MSRDWLILVRDMKEFCAKIKSYTEPISESTTIFCGIS